MKIFTLYINILLFSHFGRHKISSPCGVVCIALLLIVIKWLNNGWTIIINLFCNFSACQSTSVPNCSSLFCNNACSKNNETFVIDKICIYKKSTNFISSYIKLYLKYIVNVKIPTRLWNVISLFNVIVE